MKNRDVAWILTGVWLAAFAWRPFLLGFYSEDYFLFLKPLSEGIAPAPFFIYITNTFAHRPLSGLVAFFCAQVYGNHAFLWHCFAALTCLIIGGLLWLVLKQLNQLNDPLKDSQLAWLTALWWLLPTSYGFVSWPTHMVQLPVVPLFLLSFYFLIKDRSLSLKSFSLALFFYLLCLFTHEGFYLQYLVPFAILLLYKKEYRLSLRKWGLWLGAFTCVQGGAILFIHLVAGGAHKQFDPVFTVNRILKVLQNPRYWVDAVIPLIIVIGSTYCAFRIYKTIRRNPGRIPHNSLLFLIFLGGLLLSVFLYLGAGYSIRPFGLGSRSTMCISVLFIGLLLPVLKSSTGSLKIKKYLLWGLTLIMAVTSGVQGYHWHASWVLQKKVMVSIPEQQFLNFREPAIVLCLVPNYQGHVLVFEEFWTLEPAVHFNYPQLRQKKLHFLPHKNSGFRAAESIFADNEFRYRPLYSGHTWDVFQGDYLYFWNFYTGELYEAQGDIAIPPHLKPQTFQMEKLRPISSAVKAIRGKPETGEN
jgi:hypothetical protein